MRGSLMIYSLLPAGLIAGAARAEEELKLEDAIAPVSYSLGHQMGQDLKRQKVTLDRAAMLRGITDGQSGAEPLMKPERKSIPRFSSGA